MKEFGIESPLLGDHIEGLMKSMKIKGLFYRQCNALQLAAITMTIYSIAIIISLTVLFCRCGNDEFKSTTFPRQKEKSITGIEIYLLPAFNCDSRIVIDKVSNSVKFILDETGKPCYTGVTNPFALTLDSFQRNTLIDSFYSHTFLDSIRFAPGDVPAFDGLSILTVINRGRFSDTVNSSNVYPKILADNIISQIEYISENTTDTVLNKYIKDLRRYFH